jgi:hypothetical protein
MKTYAKLIVGESSFPLRVGTKVARTDVPIHEKRRNNNLPAKTRASVNNTRKVQVSRWIVT